MALFSLVDEDLEHFFHLGQLPSRACELGLQLLRPVIHDRRDGVDGVIQAIRVVVDRLVWFCKNENCCTRANAIDAPPP